MAARPVELKPAPADAHSLDEAPLQPGKHGGLLGLDDRLLDIVRSRVDVGVAHQCLRLGQVMAQANVGMGEAGRAQEREGQAQRLASLVHKSMAGDEPAHDVRAARGLRDAAGAEAAPAANESEEQLVAILWCRVRHQRRREGEHPVDQVGDGHAAVAQEAAPLHPAGAALAPGHVNEPLDEGILTCAVPAHGPQRLCVDEQLRADRDHVREKTFGRGVQEARDALRTAVVRDGLAHPPGQRIRRKQLAILGQQPAVALGQHGQQYAQVCEVAGFGLADRGHLGARGGEQLAAALEFGPARLNVPPARLEDRLDLLPGQRRARAAPSAAVRKRVEGQHEPRLHEVGTVALEPRHGHFDRRPDNGLRTLGYLAAAEPDDEGLQRPAVDVPRRQDPCAGGVVLVQKLEEAAELLPDVAARLPALVGKVVTESECQVRHKARPSRELGKVDALFQGAGGA